MVINDAVPSARVLLTKRSTQDEISRRNNALIVTRGRFISGGPSVSEKHKDAKDASERPLHLRITPGFKAGDVSHTLLPALLPALVSAVWVHDNTAAFFVVLVSASGGGTRTFCCCWCCCPIRCRRCLHVLQTDDAKWAAVDAAVADVRAVMAGVPLAQLPPPGVLLVKQQQQAQGPPPGQPPPFAAGSEVHNSTSVVCSVGVVLGGNAG